MSSLRFLIRLKHKLQVHHIMFDMFHIFDHAYWTLDKYENVFDTQLQILLYENVCNIYSRTCVNHLFDFFIL